MSATKYRGSQLASEEQGYDNVVAASKNRFRETISLTHYFLRVDHP
jgi:hypothetical protein